MSFSITHPSFHLIFGNRVSLAAGAHRLSYTARPLNPHSLPDSDPPGLGLQVDSTMPALYVGAEDPKQSWYRLWAGSSQWDRAAPQPSATGLKLYTWATIHGVWVHGSSVDHVCVRILKICLKRRPLVARVILVQVGTRNKAAFQGPHGL